jgi:hypothetical protein
MHRVHARTRFTVPSGRTWRTCWRLGYQIRLVLLLAWLTLLPTVGVFPQNSQIRLIESGPFTQNKRAGGNRSGQSKDFF